MNEIDVKPTLAEMTKPRSPQGDPEYLAWAEQKIKDSIVHDKANPEGRIPLAAVMKQYGVR